MQPELLWHKTLLCSINKLFYIIRDMRAQTQAPLCIIDHHFVLITQKGWNINQKRPLFCHDVTFFHLPTLVQGPKRFVKNWNGCVFWGGFWWESPAVTGWETYESLLLHQNKRHSCLSHCRCWLLSLCSFSPSANSRLSASFLMQYY